VLYLTRRANQNAVPGSQGVVGSIRSSTRADCDTDIGGARDLIKSGAGRGTLIAMQWSACSALQTGSRNWI